MSSCRATNAKPTCRVWRFPRLSPQYGRFAIWNERGTYEVMVLTRGKSIYGHRADDDVLESTGFVSATLGEAFANVRAMTATATTSDASQNGMEP